MLKDMWFANKIVTSIRQVVNVTMEKILVNKIILSIKKIQQIN